MSYLSFNPSDASLDLSDEHLGRLLLESFILIQADDLGIPADQISQKFYELVRDYILTIEAKKAEFAAVEKALHKAARGDFQTAGRLLREHLDNSAIAMRFVPIGINKSLQAARFGRKGAEANKKEGEANQQVVLAAAKKILTKRTRRPSNRELGRLIEQETGIAADTVRGHLTTLRKKKILD